MKWRYLPFSIFIFVLSIEILLRLISWGLSVKAVSSIVGSSDIRIVTLGESTSTDNFEGVHSWPQQLKTELAGHGINAEITNLAKPGTNSFYLVQKLKSSLHTLRPQIVIAMMGVNDAVSLEMQESFWLRNFYIARVFKWYQFLHKDDYSDNNVNVHNKKGINPSETDFELPASPELPSIRKKAETYFQELAATSVKDTKNFAEKLAATEPQHFAYIIYHAVNSLFSNMTIHQYRKFMILNQFLLDHNLFDENIVYYRLYSDWSERNIKACTDFTYLMWQRHSYQFSERHLSMIANCISAADATQKIAFEEVIKSQELGFTFLAANDPNLNLTAQSYRKLYDLSVTHNFQLVIMQYPLEPVSKLRGLFTTEESEKIIFVSNFENFSNQLQSKKFEELFLDHFAKNFGHPNEAGHKLIAGQLVDVLLPLLKPE